MGSVRHDQFIAEREKQTVSCVDMKPSQVLGKKKGKFLLLIPVFVMTAYAWSII